MKSVILSIICVSAMAFATETVRIKPSNIYEKRSASSTVLHHSDDTLTVELTHDELPTSMWQEIKYDTIVGYVSKSKLIYGSTAIKTQSGKLVENSKVYEKISYNSKVLYHSKDTVDMKFYGLTNTLSPFAKVSVCNDSILGYVSVYDIVDLKAPTEDTSIYVIGGFDVGYAGYFADGVSYHGFVLGGSGGKKYHAGVDMAFAIYKDEIGYDSIVIKYDNHNNVSIIETKKETMKIESHIINPIVYIGGQFVKFGVGAFIVSSSVDDSYSSTSCGMSMALKVNVPTDSPISPFIDASYNNVDNSGMFGLKVGFSIGQHKI